MSDYIDRKAAIAYAISGRIRTLPTSEDGENWIRTAEVRQSLLDVPSAEVEPVKHGKWIDKGKDKVMRWICPECGRKDKYIYNYCPDCGAKMDL